MSKSNYQQADFRGGVWNPISQGRSDVPAYHTALNVCLNAIPTEEGAWSRRPGTQFLGPTNGRLLPAFKRFESTAGNPYLMEFTNDALRLWYDHSPVGTNDHQVITASSSSGGVISLTTTTNHGWSVGDALFLVTSTALAAANLAVVQGRQFKIATTDGATGLTMKDDLGNALPADISVNGLNGATAIRILKFTTTYTTAFMSAIRVVQAQQHAYVLSSQAAPQVLGVTSDVAQTTSVSPVMTWGAATLTDGPYLDPQGTITTPETGTVSAYTGSITFTPATTTFTATDVGRLIRLFSQPAAWASGTTYAYGDTVTYNGEYWTSVNQSGSGYTNLNQVPGAASIQSSGVAVVFWAPAPEAGVWAWGTITAQASTSCTVSLTTNLNSANGATISQWMLGVYKSGQYPTCGVFYKGRLWLAGAVLNRFDACMANGINSDGSVTFSPTDVYGNVNDDHAISGTLNFKNLVSVYWMEPDHQGLLVGTSGPEFLIHTSSLNDPMTPFSVDADPVSNYQSAAIEPVRPGMALVYVQRYGKRLLEFLADAFTGKYSARHINEFARHLVDQYGILQIAYQEEKVPTIWVRTGSGQMLGVTYRRVSRFVTEAPLYQGWHEVDITATDMSVWSMQAIPAVDGLSDELYISPYDGTYYWVEMMRPLFEAA